jgi:hypothetical protein
VVLFKLASGLSASIEVHRPRRRWLFVPMATCGVFHTLEPLMRSQAKTATRKRQGTGRQSRPTDKNSNSDDNFFTK